MAFFFASPAIIQTAGNIALSLYETRGSLAGLTYSHLIGVSTRNAVLTTAVAFGIIQTAYLCTDMFAGPGGLALIGLWVTTAAGFPVSLGVTTVALSILKATR